MKRLWLLALLFLLTPLAARANQTAQGWCEAGGQVVVTSGLRSTSKAQLSYPSCTVTVFLHGGGLATIFSDAAGTPLANPFTAQTNGQWLFYAANGHYDIQLSGAGMPTTITYSDILLDDPGAFGSLFGVYQGVTWSSAITFNASLASIFNITLTGNNTSSSVTNPLQNGQVIGINLCQDATGGRAFTWPANFLNTSFFTIGVASNVCTPTSWFYDGTNWRPFGGGGSGGGGGTAGGVNTQLQCNALNAFGGCTGLFDDGTLFAADVNAAFKGPNPVRDVTRYGVRSCTPTVTPCAVGLTANTTVSSAVVTISAASSFVNGDGVVIYGAGPPHALATPSAPTVAPSLAQVGTGTGFVTTGLTGATRYDYKIAARTKAQGMTAASAAGFTTTGAAALGSQSVALTSASRSNDVVTVVTSSAHGLAVGAMVYITQTVDGSFGGWFRVDTVADTTHFTFSSGMDTRTGASTSTTGGTAYWFNANHLSWSAVTGAWEYYVWRSTDSGATWVLVGVGRPQGSVITDLTLDDFGATMMGGIVLPPFVSTTTPPAAATSDSLVTTIVSGAGTTTLTLANVAGTTVTGATIRLDQAPNILAAANAATGGGGTLYFPAGGTYVVNSYLTLPKVTVSQAGTIQLNETVQIGGGGSQWWGALAPQPSNNAPSFSFQGGPQITVNTANPGIFVDVDNQNSAVYSGITVSGVSPNGLLWVSDKGSHITWSDINFSTSGSASDFMGIGLLVRGVTNDNPFGLYLRRVLFIGGPSQVNGTSATPLFFCHYCGQTIMDGVNTSRRGILYAPGAAGGDFRVTQGRAQGGIMPSFMATSQPTGTVGGSFQIDGFELDTMAHALFANLPQGSGSTFFSLLVNGGIPNPSSDGVSVPGMTTGRAVSFLSGSASDFTGQSRNAVAFSRGTALDGAFATGIGTSASYSLSRLAAGQALSPNFPLFADQLPVAAPTCTVAAGGSLPTGTYNMFVVPVWQNGAEGTQSLPCSVTITTGNQTVNMTWTAAAGSPKGYNVRRTNQTWPVGAADCTTFPQYTGTSATITSGSSCGTAPTLPAGGPSYVNTTEVAAPQVRIGGESLAAAPRALPNVTLMGALTTTWTGGSFTLDKAVTVTRVQIQAKVAPSGCSPNAVVRLTDGTTAQDVTVSAAANDSGAVAKNYAAGAVLTVAVQTAAGGCSTSPGDANVLVQYKMQ